MAQADHTGDNATGPRPRVTELHGTGLCAEAQADGVPCEELDRDCVDCGRSVLDGVAHGSKHGESPQ